MADKYIINGKEWNFSDETVEPFDGSSPGLVPEVDKEQGEDGKFLRGDGTWANPGGSGGTSDYRDLTHLPTINTVEVKGDLTSADLGINIPTKVSELQNDSEFITADDLPIASDEQLGMVKAGNNITIEADGTINASGGGSGDAELEVAVTSNLAVGAIASGTTLAAGTTFTEFAQKLLITEVAPTIGFSISKSGNVLYGGSYTETLTVNVSAMGSAKKIKSIAWYEGNTLKQTDTIDSTVAGSWTYTMGTATTDTTTFKAIVTYTKSNDTDTTSTKTASISFFYNKFYGAVDSLTPTEASVEALTTALGTGKGGSYVFNTSAARICYAYPKSLGALTSIKDGNGFSLFDSFTRTEQTYTQNGTSVAYYRYVLTDASSVSNYTVIFA